MKVKRILATKSGSVITIRPEQPIRDAVALLGILTNAGVPIA